MKVLTDIHSHTIASTHAYSTVQELIQAAVSRGLQAFAITDHSPPMPDAPHFWHFVNMKVLPRIVDDVAVLRGMEANIEAKGIDVDDEYLQKMDFVIASFHEPVFAPAGEVENTRAMIAAIESGHCQAIGHPGNPNYPIDVDAVILAAKKSNVLLEINNSSFLESRKGSEKNCLKLLERIGHHGWRVCFGSDAHISYQLGHFSQCVAAMETVGLGKEYVANSSARRLLDFLREHGKSVSNELRPWMAQLSEE